VVVVVKIRVGEDFYLHWILPGGNGPKAMPYQNTDFHLACILFELIKQKLRRLPSHLAMLMRARAHRNVVSPNARRVPSFAS
jgi:hypothetical protein